MDYLIILLLFLGGGVIFFGGMALFLVTIAYIFSFFTGKKTKETKPPSAQESPPQDEKPSKIA